MNKLFLRHIAFAALLSLPIFGGCKPADSAPAPAPGTNSVAETTPTSANTAGTELIAKPEIATEVTQPEVPFAVDRPIPENLNPSVPLKEVIKLAQAGVDEEVLLTFVNNATSGFHVGADEIIYLTDIGVPGTVINSMLERDKTLKTTHMTAVVPAPAATTTANAAVATAPSYLQPPTATQTEAQPEIAEANVTESNFYDTLSPYGTWIDVEGYGRCWQPTVVVVNPNWRPYCDNGRWMYTDAGWYWYSDYSWGWAPFHYGRWLSHPRWGWCWSPDYTWGPAWVTWSYSDSYCGWAPLPPAAVYTSAGFTYYGSSVGVSFGFGLGYSCYSYVPWNHFCDYRPWYYCAPRPHCKDIYAHAVCHNDYSTDGHHRTVNRGLPPERVTALSRTEIRRVSLRDVPQARPITGRGEELARDGRTLEIRRPVANAVPRTASATSSSHTQTIRDTTSSPGNIHHDRPGTSQPAERTVETAGHASPSNRQGENGHVENPTTRSARPGTARPLVVIGNGDGRPPTPSTWRPPVENGTQPGHRENFAAASPAEMGVPSAPTDLPHTTEPGRSQVIHVGRGIEDRPAGGPSYRVYSSPQREAPSAPSYGPPPTVNAPTHTRPSRANDDENNNNNSDAHQAPRQQTTYEPPRQVERPVEHAAPQRPAQVEQRPAPAPARPAPAPTRSEPSRSESRSDSRPADPGRGSRDR